MTDYGGAGAWARLRGGRLLLQHGPIDIVAEALGTPDAVERAYAAAATRFGPILGELCAELAWLRRPAEGAGRVGLRAAGGRMARATSVYAARCFMTPMAAVAGAVADEICAAMVTVPGLSRVFVNNGGDAALHLAACASITIGIVSRPDRPALVAKARIGAMDGVRGVATSGWRGRSFSLGVADAVTVFAADGASADAAATVIANAVDLPGHVAIRRCPANQLQPDSDLGDRLVTTDVGRLTAGEASAALDRGLEVACDLIRQGHIRAAALFLDGAHRLAGAGDWATPLVLPAQNLPEPAEPLHPHRSEVIHA